MKFLKILNLMHPTDPPKKGLEGRAKEQRTIGHIKNTNLTIDISIIK